MKILSLITIFAILLTVLSGCTSRIVESPTPPASVSPTSTITPAALSSNSPTPSVESSTVPYAPPVTDGQVISRANSLMADLTSCTLAVDAIDTYDYFGNDQASESISEWDTTRIIDFAHKNLQMNSDIDYMGITLHPQLSVYQMYVLDGWMYAMGYYRPLSTGTRIDWRKGVFNEETWKAETQIPNLLELLESPDSAILSGSATVSGIDCYLVDITPVESAVNDCMASQRQGLGPQIRGISSMPSSYQMTGAAYKIWVAKDSGLIMKASLSALFKVHFPSLGMGIGVDPSPTPAANPGIGTEEFHAQWYFSDFNQPVSIQLPPEAEKAVE